MRKTLLGFAAASALLLSSCSSTGGFDTTKWAAFYTAVQQGVATACSAAGALAPIIPTVESILSLYNATAGATVAGLVSGIEAVACSKTHVSSLLTVPVPTEVKVNGVTISFIIITTK